MIRFGNLRFDVESGRLEDGRETRDLPPLSCKLLLALLRHAPSAVSADTIRQEVWDGRYVSGEAIKQRVSLLRRALGDDGRNPRYVESVSGVGYRLLPCVEAQEKTVAYGDDAASGRRHPLPLFLSVVCACVLVAYLAVGNGPRLEDGQGGDALAADSTGAMAPPPLKAEQQFRQGNFFYDRRGDGDIQRAENAYLQAVALHPAFAQAWVALAGVYASMHWDYGLLAYEESMARQEAALRRALELEPALASAHIRMAVFLLSSGAPRARAEPHFRKALALAPDDPLVLTIYASHLRYRGEIDESLSLWEKAVGLNPTSAVNRHVLIHLYLRKGRLHDAEAEFRTLVSMHPSWESELAAEAALFALLRGQAQDALALSRSLDDPAAATALKAMALHDLDRPNESLQMLEQLARQPGLYAMVRRCEVETYLGRPCDPNAALRRIEEQLAFEDAQRRGEAQSALEAITLSAFIEPVRRP